MPSIVLKNASFADGSVAGIGVEDGLIVAGLPAGEERDCTGLTLFPGFIDIHNHGAVGVDVNTADLEGLLCVSAFLATQGVTAWVPTLVPDSDENYERIIGVIDELMRVQADLTVAQAVGVHYEGVFASHAMCGALRPEYFRRAKERTTPSAQGGGHPSFVRRGASDLPMLHSGVHMTTLAPEIDGGLELIEQLVADGWVVSIGHTAADPETLDEAFAAGARHMTHFFNAMTGIHHRSLGVAGWGLATEGVTFDIIADGIHVRPEMLKLACRLKSPERVSLISDSVAPTGLGDGEFDLWDETITVINGRTQNERGSIAGSVCSMLDCVATTRSVGFTDAEVSLMASANPARLLGLDGRGSLGPGNRADIVAIDANGAIAFVMVGGELLGSDE